MKHHLTSLTACLLLCAQVYAADMILTHCPFVPTPDSPDYDLKSKGSPTYKGDPKYFGDMVAYMDKEVGKIVAKLDSLGLRENTLVIFTGDNGTDQPIVSMMNGKPVAGGKGQSADAGTRVPLIANWSGVVKKGVVSADLVDFTDFLPTLCEAARAKVPEDLKIDGRSFLPQLRGEKGQPRDWVYSWYSPKGGPAAKRESVRNQRYKLYATGELYDISHDVLEKKPIPAPSPQEIQIREALQKALDQFKDARPTTLTKSKEFRRKPATGKQATHNRSRDVRLLLSHRQTDPLCRWNIAHACNLKIQS